MEFLTNLWNNQPTTVKDIAFLMGHTVEVHQQNYARFMPEDTHAKFEKQLAA